MSILEIDDIIYQILNQINIDNLDTIISLTIVNKQCYHFVTNTNLYKELIVLRKYYPRGYDFHDYCTIELMCKLNLENILKKELDSKQNAHYFLEKLIIGASTYGRINLLQLFIKDDFKITKFDKIIIDATEIAVEKGHIAILKWFYKFGYKFNNCWSVVKEAICNNQIDILKWFLNIGYKIEFSKYKILFIKEENTFEYDYPWSCNGMYVYSGPDLKRDKNGYFDLIKWLFEFGNGFKFPKTLLRYVIRNNHIHILDWIKNTGYEFQCFKDFILQDYCCNDHINVLEWCQKNRIGMKITDHFVIIATISGHINILEFLNSHVTKYYDKSNHCWINVHFKDFIYSIRKKNLKCIKFYDNCYESTLEKYNRSVNWYKKMGFDISRIKLIYGIKIKRKSKTDEICFSW